jgi:hypothetical protein
MTKQSSTLIDNIFSNNLENKIMSGLLITDISDHLPVFSILCNSKLSCDTQLVHKRILSAAAIEAFSKKLSETNWNDVLTCQNGRDAFSKFYEKLLNMYNEYFPLKTFRKQYYFRKSWLSEQMKQCIKTKNRLYIRSIKFPTEMNISNYKDYKRILNRLLRKTERDHYNSLFLLNKTNIKRQWKILKNVINKQKTMHVPTQFIFGNQIVTDQNVIANKFNKYFANVGNDLANNIPDIDLNPLSFIDSNNSSIFLSYIEENEVERIIKTLKEVSPGKDGIHSKVIKATYHLYLSPFTHVLNLTFAQGVFPNELKLAKIVPLFKSGDSQQISNYRPVSILSLFSKIVEKLMYNRLYSFIGENDILYKYQFSEKNTAPSSI